ncbi:MAG: glycosyltransferase [Peptococcaceae bacterium]|nr:glycosyltransferase [Peptococcaceae bacterium]
MNILHLIGGGELGGAEQHLITLLPRLHARGVQPLLGCLYKHSPLADIIQSETTPVRLFPMRAPFDLTPLPSLLKYCAHHKIHLIHSHGLRANILGRAAGLFSHIPSVTTWHSWPEHDFPGTITGRTAMTLEHITLRHSAGSITVSKELAKKFQQWPPMNRRTSPKRRTLRHLSPKRPHHTQTIYNGYAPFRRTPEEHAQARQHYRTLWGIPENAVVIGTIGRLHPVKGHQHLLQAVALLTSRLPTLNIPTYSNPPLFHLLLIGEGPERPNLEHHLAHAPYTYTLTGHIPDAERVLPAIDIFVFPSLHEGLGIALLEAIQARLPIVATAVGGIPEILRADSDALLVPPADPDAIAAACQTLLENPAQRESLIAAAQTRLSLFDPDNMADQTITFYHNILDP